MLAGSRYRHSILFCDTPNDLSAGAQTLYCVVALRFPLRHLWSQNSQTKNAPIQKMSQQEIEQLWELQGRQAELRRHVLQLTSQINVAQRERSVLGITVRELDAMPNESKVYMAVGKMFALNPKDELRSELVQAREESLKKDDDRKRLRDQFVNKLRESEDRIGELANQIDLSRSKAREAAKRAEV